MASELTQRVDGEFPEDQENLLPADNVLSLGEYLAMHAALGNRTPTKSAIGSSTAGR